MLLVAVWAMSGAWALAHSLDHALHHESTHQEASWDAGPAVALEAAHGHGHSHPDLSPVVLTGKLQQRVALAPPSDAAEPARESLRSWFRNYAAAARGAPRLAAPSGPRAPPIA